MNEILLNNIRNTAKDFADIAKRVNISSRLRTNHTREALACINHVISLGSFAIDDLDDISEKNDKKKEIDLKAKSTCNELNKEIGSLSQLIDDIKKSSSIKEDTNNKIMNIFEDINNSVLNAGENLDLIISNSEAIIKEDKEILKLKNTQQKLLQNLRDDTQKSYDDAIRAVKGSLSNLERGLQLVDYFEQIEIFIDNRNLDILNRLYNKTRKGWQIAESVNQSSRSQLEFAEKVYENTKKLYDESMHINNLVNSRHKHFEESTNTHNALFEILTELTILLTELNTLSDLPDVKESGGKLINKMTATVKEISDKTNQFINQIQDKMQYGYYSGDESNTIEITSEEIQYLDKIFEEIEFMTETTRYPIEGSNNNITNGQLLEQLLEQIFNENDIPIQEKK
jgi:methyl-accepting chemotaxis protein